jgi:hypothetical protein
LLCPHLIHVKLLQISLEVDLLVLDEFIISLG